jgi:hypothetical protein
MGKIKEFLQNQRVKTFLWNTLGAFLSMLAIYLGDLDPKFNILLVPVILAITKYINLEFCSKKTNLNA